MRILLADDEPKVCSAVRFILDQDPLVEGISEVGDAQQLLEACAQCEPDLILLDWELPSQMPVGHLLAKLRVQCPQVRIVALSGRPMVRKLALSLGANEFVCKGDPPDVLLRVLNSLSEPYIPPDPRPRPALETESNPETPPG